MKASSYYEASVQIPHTEGFWMPHTEWDYQVSAHNSICDAMQWLANNESAYDESADVYISLVINGYYVVIWQFKDGCVTHLAMKPKYTKYIF